MKKYNKLLILFLCTFFVGITPSFAREMTLDEVEEELKEISPNSTYIYVIGEYAFSSTHEFTRQDSMLAGRSIKVKDVDGKINKDPIYGEMTIARYQRVVDEDYNPIGLKFIENMIGETVPAEKIDIKYIDYVYVGYPTDATISTNVEADKEELKTKFEYDVTKGNTSVTLEDGKLKGFISKDDANGELFSSIPEDRTGYYFPINVKVPGATDKTTITYGTDKKFANSGDLTILFALNPNAENKIIEIIVDLDGDEKEYKPTKYTIDYSELEFQAQVTVSTKEDFIAALNKKVEKIVLANNIELAEKLQLEETDKVEIDLNEKELTLKSPIYSKGDLTISNGIVIADTNAVVANGGKVTLNEVEITSSKYGVSVEDGAELVVNGGKIVSADDSALALFVDAVVTLDGVTVEGKLGGIGANATKPYKKLEVKNSTIKSVGEPAIFFPGSSVDGKTPELIVTDSMLEGISGIDARSGKIVISNSTIIALGTDDDWEYVKNHDTASGTTDGAAALYLHSQSPYSNGGTLSVDITNSTLVNKNNTKGVIRIYEHGNAGVTTITVNSDVEYLVAEELREESKVTVNVNVPDKE